jgi:tetratricopeptide (TPR) repeat protein
MLQTNVAQSAIPAFLLSTQSQNPIAVAVMPRAQVESTGLKLEAVVVAHEVAEAYPDDPLSYALLGSAYYNTGKSEEARKQLLKCLALNPGQAEAYDILARIAYEKSELEETLRLCEEALKRGVPNPELLNRKGRALMDMGRTEEAIQTLQQAVHLPKPASESYYLLGQANLQSGEHARAKESFQRAVALLPEHTQAYFGLYTACMRLGETDEGERYRQQFVQLEAVDRRTLIDRNAEEDTLTGLPLVQRTVAKTLFGAGQVYRVHEQASKASEFYRKSAALDPDSPIYRATLEQYYVQRGAIPEGISVFEQLAKEQPDNGLNYFFLGRLHNRMQRFEEAEAAYRKVQELGPKWSEGYRALADLYLRANRKLPEARVMADRACELEPSGPNLFLLALTCAKNNDRPAAIMAANKALAISPSEAKYQELLKQLKEAP